MYGVPTSIVSNEIYWGSENETLDAVVSYALGQDTYKVDDKLVTQRMFIEPSANRQKMLLLLSKHSSDTVIREYLLLSK